MNGMLCIAGSLIISVSVATQGLAQHVHSSYAGQEIGAVKSLTPEEVDNYLNGRGMGLAKAAELNHYPGPMHVLEFSEKLRLSPEQKSQIEVIYGRMHLAAVEVGKEIISNEKSLDSLFSYHRITAERLEKYTVDIAVLQGKLRVVHLAAHLETEEVLTSAQVEQYDNLRGYHLR